MIRFANSFLRYLDIYPARKYLDILERVTKYPAPAELARSYFISGYNFSRYLRPVNQTSNVRIKAWLITDIAVLIEFFNTLMISGGWCDSWQSHQLFAGNRKRADKIIFLPADKQRRAQTDMGGQQASVLAHPPDQPAVIRKREVRLRLHYFEFPSRILWISSSL